MVKLPPIKTMLGKLLRARRRRAVESEAAAEVRDELDFYIDMRTRELTQIGMPAEAARERALKAFGDIETVDAECRRLTVRRTRKARRGQLLDALVRDTVSAARALRRRPLLTTAAVAILATGLAATSVVYGLVDALLLRSLPLPRPQELVSLYNYSEEAGYFSSVSYPDFLDYRQGARSFTDLFAYSSTDVTLGWEGTQPRTVSAHPVTSGYFRGVGISAAAGRFFGSASADVQGQVDAVVVISHSLWRQQFGATTDVVGTTVTLNGMTATIVGVAAPGFRGLDKETIADLWIPIGLYAQMTPSFAPYMYGQRGAHWLTVVGRLRAGASIDDARAELTVLSSAQAAAYPESNAEWRLRLFDAGAGVIWPERRGGMIALSGTLMAGVTLVLLIACANVANLLLVRAAGRRAEFSVRHALGANRATLMRQLLIESLLLAAASGGLGLLLAAWIRATLGRAVVPAELGYLVEAGTDGRTLAFTLAAAMIAGIAFGLAPALRASRPDLMATLRSRTRQAGGRGLSLGSALVVAQISLSLPLLVGAALIGQSLWNQLTVDLGLSTDDLVLMVVDPAAGGYDHDQGERIYGELLRRVAGMPGVVDAAYTKVVPLGDMRMATDVRIPGHEPPSSDDAENVEINIVSPGYPATSGATLLRGRDFSPRDTVSSTPVVIINEVMSARYWRGVDPVGETVEVDWFDGPVLASIVGVIADHHYARVREGQVQVAGDRPRLYMPLAQSYQTSMTLLVRTSTDAAALARAVVATMRELSPATPDVEVVSFREHVARLLPQQRLVAILLIIASGIGLCLAAVGIYAVMAYSVSRRVHEMGIRRALGAQRGDVLRLVMREGLTLCFAGIAVGTLAAAASSRLLASMLYGVEATDPASYLGVIGVIVAVALLAGYLPARDAAGSDPLPVLRRP